MTPVKWSLKHHVIIYISKPDKNDIHSVKYQCYSNISIASKVPYFSNILFTKHTCLCSFYKRKRF